MKLTYETGIATLIQFIILSLLNIGTSLNSIVTTCHRDSHDCISNLIVSMIVYILLVAWFAALWVLGYAAQDRRSKRLAQLLIGAEALVALIAFFNARHHTDALSLITSLLDLALALWIILLAFRLMRARGGRVVVRGGRARARRRRSATPTKDL